MERFAIIVSRRLCDLTHEVVVENIGAIVDDILDERDKSTIVISSDVRRAGITTSLLDYLPQEEVLVLPVW